jgi:hypothetical protein
MSRQSTSAHRLSIGHPARWSVVGALVGACALLWTAAGNATPTAAQDRAVGWRAKLGQGTASSFAELQPDGAPRTIGIAVTGDALASLPQEPTDGHHCFDRDGNGAIAQDTECVHTHEFVIPLPDAVSQRADMPFKWVLLNWNAHGHVPPGVYDVPHFDIHFYMQPIEDVFAIGDGPCGPEFTDCDDYALAKKPLPADLMHPDFKDVDAVAPAMGNHLIDLSGQEFHGAPFTRSWIFGMFDGRVTFYEQMIALSYLRTRPNDCAEIKSPPAVDLSGYYPTEYCVHYDAGADAYSVSLEGFTYREAR